MPSHCSVIRKLTLLGGEIHCFCQEYKLVLTWTASTDSWTMRETAEMNWNSDDYDLGPRYATHILEARTRHHDVMEELPHLRNDWRQYQEQEETRSRKALEELTKKKKPSPSKKRITIEAAGSGRGGIGAVARGLLKDAWAAQEDWNASLKDLPAKRQRKPAAV